MDAERNRLTTRTEEGVSHTYSPTKLKSVEVYREEGCEVVTGERIQFRAPLKPQQIPNGALGRIEKLDYDTGEVTIALDAGPSLTTKLKDLRHIEYGYATTSHSSQGATIDRVLVNIDTEQSVALVNQQQFYVSLSRARHDARIFTNNRVELSHVVSRFWPKATALEAVAPSANDPYYDKPRDRERNRNVTRQHAQQHREVRRTPHVFPVSLLPHQLAPSTSHGRHQRDAASLINHHQRDWAAGAPPPSPRAHGGSLADGTTTGASLAYAAP